MTSNVIKQKIDSVLIDLSKYGLNVERFKLDQFDVVYRICDNIINNKKKSTIIEAPTGAGKSIITIVSSLVLNRSGLKGYIVTSDLQLQKQYEDDFKKYNLNFGSVKGVDNYICSLNNERFSIGECQQRGMNMIEIDSLDCSNDCPYLKERRKAVDSNTTLLNYSYFLLQLNYVNRDGQGAFKPRDFAFFDEAHLISGIVQNHFAPMIHYNFEQEMKTILSMIDDRIGFKHYLSESILYGKIYLNLLTENDTSKILIILKELQQKLQALLSFTAPIKERLKQKYPINIIVPKSESLMIKKMDFLKDCNCKLEDFIEIIENIGNQNIVKVLSDKNDLQFKNIEEGYLMEKHFHNHCLKQVFLSATIGNTEIYSKLNMIKEYDSIELTSNFDFNKSPICIYFPTYKMSYREKDSSFPLNLKRMKTLLKYHKNDKGIIHSGSYELTKMIIDNADCDRLIPYFGSEQKREALKRLEESENGILIGPSILAGIDLYDDLSRFQIFFKIPYMSLSDEFVKKKMNKYPDWYKWNTVINIIQGIGRSIRHKEDYCKSYILDGNFNNEFISGKVFPNYITKRINIIDDQRKKITKLNFEKPFIG